MSSTASASEMTSLRWTSLRSHASGAQPIMCRSWEAAADLAQHREPCQSQWSGAHTADTRCPSPRPLPWRGPPASTASHSSVLKALVKLGLDFYAARVKARQGQVEKRRKRGGECALPGGGKEEKASGTKGSGDSGGEGGRSLTTTFSACASGPSP